MQVLLWILLFTFLSSVISLVGVFFLSLRKKTLNKYMTNLVSFAAGALMAAAFLELLPESLELSDNNPAILAYTLAGVLIFFVIEQFLLWSHCHHGACEVHTFSYLILIGDAVHNFVDGVIITASFLVSVPAGLTTGLAIIFHELPQEIGDFSVLLFSGLSRARALTYNFLSALTAFAGALLAFYFKDFLLGTNQYLLALAAGGFIYIASADLLPELHKERIPVRSLAQFASLLVGVLLIWGVGVVFG
ncbi:MAG: ZIP family metal transporter [Candidatus Aenigmarchaeota archaeon]|nr:ZIP family metal transporter [Candidatus Aenigmarchaeota archaeon]